MTHPTPPTALHPYRAAHPACSGRSAQPACEAGSVSLFLIVAVLALLAVFGLVVDGGRRLDAQRHVTDIAEQAARAAAQAIDPAALRANVALRVDPAAARHAAAAYLNAAPGVTLTRIAVDAAGVTVTVTSTIQPAVLDLVGIGSLTVTGTGHAELLTPTATTVGAAGLTDIGGP